MPTLKETIKEVQFEVVDIDENSEIAIEYGVRSVPTMVMVEDNVVLKSIVGIRSKQQLEAWINE
jgi:thioredoxin 1